MKKKQKVKSNPSCGAVEIYGKIISIEAQKGKDSLWPNEFFRHDFKKNKTSAKIFGMPDGSLRIVSTKGKRLWKNFSYGKDDI